MSAGCCEWWHYPEEHAISRGVPGDEKHDAGCACWCRTTPLPPVMLIPLGRGKPHVIRPRVGTTMRDWNYTSYIDLLDLRRAHDVGGTLIQLLGMGGQLVRQFSRDGTQISAAVRAGKRRLRTFEGISIAIWDAQEGTRQ